MAAIKIGESIRHRHFNTVVFDDTFCASACALIWLGGEQRFAGSNAHIGFHAAYVGRGWFAHETGMGNALVGAYMTRLGYPVSAVLFATQAPPDSVQWLSPSDIPITGITFNVLPPPSHDTPPSSDDETSATRFVVDYFDYWSRGGADVGGLAQYYDTSVNFFGSIASRSEIMDKKMRFAARWPIRHYVVRSNSVVVHCLSSCEVTGLVDWEASSPERGARSSGVSSFAFNISMGGTQSLILGEDSHLIQVSREAEPAPSQPMFGGVPKAAPYRGYQSETNASDGSQFEEGRQARTQYENWVNALPPGDYRDGALFWAANRSARQPPSCAQTGMSAEWQQGCAASRNKLAGSDIRRRTEPQFKMGWNSY